MSARFVLVFVLVAMLASCRSEPNRDSPSDSETDAAMLDVAPEVVDVAPDATDSTFPPGPDDARAAELAAARAACTFQSGALPADTVGFTEAQRAALPITHIIIALQENRSFDHHLGRLPHYGHREVDGIPDDYTNVNPAGGTIAPAHAEDTCMPGDIPHGWDPMHQQWHAGAMDFFFVVGELGGGNGKRAISWHDERDLPFYYWLYSTFAMSDRFFASLLGPTAPNRSFFLAGTSQGLRSSVGLPMQGPSLFDQLDAADVSWAAYGPDSWRLQYVGIQAGHPNLRQQSEFFVALANDTLPAVSFVDEVVPRDEHPPGNVQDGEAWIHELTTAVFASPGWGTTALIIAYDEAGGFFDHVPPPAACPPDTSAANSEFNRLGFRVPLVVVSPWARRGYVSHVVHDLTSITRFIEVVHDLPALTARDANAAALLDLFDFTTPPRLALDTPPAPGFGGCPVPMPVPMH